MTINLTIQRETILQGLQLVAGIVDKRSSMPILANALFEISQDSLKITATDLEIELTAIIPLENIIDTGRFTMPVRKVMDICKSLPDETWVEIEADEKKLTITCNNSAFSLVTLPAEDFPDLDNKQNTNEFNLNCNQLFNLIESVSFSMAQQDIRYYLNGMLLEITNNHVRTVATDGHRLALSQLNKTFTFDQKIIVPRKAVLELHRLMHLNKHDLDVSMEANHLRVVTSDFIFITKLIDGRYPDYERVIPKPSEKQIIIARGLLKLALQRAGILANEKYHGVKITVKDNKFIIHTHNAEQEQAHEELDVEYSGPEITSGYNLQYLLDILNVVADDYIKIIFANEKNSILIETNDKHTTYVVMPMR
jgi:DNA polymerase-3 subunit beta